MPEAQDILVQIYEEVMWLARRPNVTPGNARAWYTHVWSQKLRRQVRYFSGRVSRAAIDAPVGERLALEHYGRIQAGLSELVERHLRDQISDPAEFCRTIIEKEKVHIVTEVENRRLQHSRADYTTLGIVLIDWVCIPPDRQERLWMRKLQGHVANSSAYRPAIRRAIER